MRQVRQCPNVLLLVDQRGACWSSQEDFCLRMAEALAERGGACVVAYSSRPAPRVEEALLAAGAVLEVAGRSGKSLLGFCWQIRGLCLKCDVDIVHLRHYPPSTPLTALLPLVAPCPVVLTNDASGESDPKRGLKRAASHAFNRMMNAGIARLIAPSRFVHGRLVRFRGLPARRVACISNGVDLERFARRDPAAVRREIGLSDREAVILTAAHLIPVKAVDLLIRAFAGVARNHEHVILVIAGEGPERAGLERLAAELGVSARTKFLGARSDLPDLLSAAAVFCCPSVWGESFGWVNLEAMACEAPVVSTTTGAIPEVVAHGECGLLVPPGDPEAMRSAIAELLASPERCAAMGKAGRQRAERLFDLDEIVRQHLELYGRVARR